MSVSCDNVQPNGYSTSWKYLFDKRTEKNSMINKICIYSADCFGVYCDTVYTEPARLGAAYISKEWMDSDEALIIAEKNGGGSFRKEYNDCLISVICGEAVVPNSVPDWYIKYKSKSDKTKYMTMGINAVTGEFRK